MQRKKVMKRQASDNKYLHKDFHLSMNILLEYIYRSFGRGELIKYLTQYAEAYYKPLNEKLIGGEMEVLYQYFAGIYEKEEWPVKLNYREDYLEIEQDACPGISHIRAKGEKPCPHYRETYFTVYKTLCMNTPFGYELEYFDEETGACRQSFKRK
ncbi:MAG: hypothetical protein ABFS38_19490 [Bacteroidota bacterium]